MSAQPRDNTGAPCGGRPTLHRFTTRNRCPHCDHDAPCIYFDNGDVLCHREGQPGNWTDSFNGGYWWRATNATGDRPAPRRIPAPSTRPIAPADLDRRSAVYADLLRICPLSQDQLAAHQLTNAQAHRYGWLPSDPADQARIVVALLGTYTREELLGVPGFRAHNGHITIRGGDMMMLPTRDLDRQIHAIDLRREVVQPKQSRYVKLSSRTDGDQDAPSPGAPAHVALPAGGVTVDGVIGVTEGVKKADYAADALGYPVVSIPGVGSWRAAVGVIERFAGNVVVLMLDQDDPEKNEGRTVATVERARTAIATDAVSLGYAVRLATWDHTHAKGIDDLLAAGRTFTLERYCPAADEPDTAAPPLHGPAAATTSAADLELIATQRAELADCKAQIKAWESLFMNDALPRKAQKVLVHFHKRFGAPLGRTLPDAMPCTLYADEQDIKAHGLGVSGYDEGRDVLLNLGLLTREKRTKVAAATDTTDDATDTRRGRGKDWFYLWGLNGPAVNAFWQQLPTLTEIAPTERQVKAVEGRKERLACAVAEGRATPQVVAVLKREVERAHEERGKVTYERDALTYERDAAREAAEAAARERDQALESAQRIIRESQQPATGDAGLPARLMCRAGCGSFITPAEWCCDECRERERAERGDLRLNVNLNSFSETLPLDVTNSLNVNLKSAAPADGALKPCGGGCGTLTPHGWECKACRAQPVAAPLLRCDHAAPALLGPMAPSSAGAPAVAP